MIRGYTEEQERWLYDCVNHFDNWADIENAFNKEFGTDNHNIKRLCNRKEIHLNELYGITAEQEQWLRLNVPQIESWRIITETFARTFNRPYKLTALKKICNQRGIYRLEPLGDKPCATYKPIGHICKTNTGYIRIKTKDGYKMPHTQIGKFVVHLGDKTDYNNVVVVDKKVLRKYEIECRWNKGFRNPKLKQFALKLCELEVEKEKRQLIKKKRRNNVFITGTEKST